MKYEVRFSGTGGQGIIRCAVLLAEAALYDGYYAAQSQVYGPESRGGKSQGEVVIKDTPIHYPKVTDLGILLCLSQQAYDSYAAEVIEGGMLIVDSDFVALSGKEKESVRVIGLPIIETARDMGNEMSANVVAMGTIVGLTNMVTEEAAHKALANSFRGKSLERNLKAYAEGYRLAKEMTK
ncbi:MAG: 2-oxoacid:acceptor oxidoreductase family protein [Firmicutes bacterium]|nr:2-oxoacid:acceptor oxidoreductase family protein [Bacillota bacterium]